MAAVIRLYRRFYRVNSNDNSDIYNLIDPTDLNAESFIKDTITLVETNLIIQRESLGVYFVDLNPIFYTYDNTYDLKWTVQYTEDVGNKILTTSFKLKSTNVSSDIQIDMEDSNLNYIIQESDTIEIEIIK